MSSAIMVYGCVEGWFTGKKLSDYFNETTSDWVNARRIVNGTDRSHEIAGHSKAFNAALEKAATITEPKQPDTPEPDATDKDIVLESLINQIKDRTGAIEVTLSIR